MAIKEIKREWSPCQLDYVETFLLHSEKDLKDLPKCCIGSKAIVSETDNEYFCTESGWKLGSELGGNSSPSEVVILPETVMAVGGSYTSITTPLSAPPEAGATAKVTYNGTEYVCTIVAADDGSIAGYMLGNLDALGLPAAGSNPDAPFMLALMPDGADGSYGTVYPLDGATTVTLSIVQTEGAASGGGSASAGGGRFVFNATVGDPNEESQGLFYVTYDKTYSEIVSAWENGAAVYCVFDVGLVFDGPESAGNYCYLPLLTHDTNSKSLECSAYAMDITLVAHVAEDSSANFFQMKFPNA